MPVVPRKVRKEIGNMAIMELLVQAAELIQAANDMNQAMETYREAVESAKAAAADLASKWEGATKDAFVAHQEKAYTWHNNIIQIVLDMIGVIRQVIDLYNDMEDAVKNVVKG